MAKKMKVSFCYPFHKRKSLRPQKQVAKRFDYKKSSNK